VVLLATMRSRLSEGKRWSELAVAGPNENEVKIKVQ